MNYGAPGIPLVPGGVPGAPPVPFNQPKQLFRYGEQSIWSTSALVVGPIASSENRLFATPIGSVGQGFTRAVTIGETNIKEGGRVPNGVAYDVFGLSAHVMALTAGTDVAGADWDLNINTQALVRALLNIIQNGVLTWDFTQTRVDIAPVNLVGSGGGVFGSLGMESNNSQQTGHFGNGPGQVWLYRKHPVALPGATTFSVLLRFGSRANAVANNIMGVKVTLFGYYKNVIEIG